MPTGTIKRLIMDRGFGFIKTDDGKDLFFHRSALQGADYKIDFDSLREGQPVQFEIGIGSDSRPQAIKIRLAPKSLIASSPASVFFGSIMPKFKKGDHVRVRAVSSSPYKGCIGVVESVAKKEPSFLYIVQFGRSGDLVLTEDFAEEDLQVVVD